MFFYFCLKSFSFTLILSIFVLFLQDSLDQEMDRQHTVPWGLTNDWERWQRKTTSYIYIYVYIIYIYIRDIYI